MSDTVEIITLKNIHFDLLIIANWQRYISAVMTSPINRHPDQSVPSRRSL